MILIFGSSGGMIFSEIEAPYELVQDSWQTEVRNDLTSVLSISVSSDTEAPYGVLLSADTEALYDANWVFNSLEGTYSIHGRIHSDLMAPYTIKSNFVINDLSLPYGINISSDLKGSFSLSTLIYTDLESQYNMLYAVSSDVAITYNLSATNFVFTDVIASYTLFDISSETIIDTFTAFTSSGGVIGISSASINIDESSFCWSLDATLVDEESWLKCPAGSELTFTLNGDPYVFIVDSRDRTISYGEWGFNISGRSNTSVYGTGALPIYKTWDKVSAYSVFSELVTSDLQIDILDWGLIAGRLVSEGETPIQIVQRLAEANGGIIYTTGSGTLVVAKKYTVPPPDYSIFNTDLTLSSLYDINSLTETKERKPGYNSVEVMDEADTSNTITSISAILIDSVNLVAELKVVLFPFVDTVTLYTSHSGVVLSPSLSPIDEEVIELVEFVDGVGSVSAPIFSIVDEHWQDNYLGDIVFDGTQLKSEVDGNSLLSLTYITQYHKVNLTASEAEALQVYM